MRISLWKSMTNYFEKKESIWILYNCYVCKSEGHVIINKFKIMTVGGEIDI